MKNLVIVESPVKTKTIEKILSSLGSKDFKITATRGHITELKNDGMHVVEKDGKFHGDFHVIKEKQGLVNNLKSIIQKSDNIYICTDDDIEGERIANDIVDICKIKKYYRVTFSEITARAVKLALIEHHNVRLIDKHAVLAQWTRRLIDRIIGYGFSPAIDYYFKKNKILAFKGSDGKLMNQKAKGIGRVIGYSLSVIAKRHYEIESFNENEQIPTDVIKAKYSHNGEIFIAKGDKLEFKKEQSSIRDDIINKANNKLHRVYDRTKEISNVAPYSALSLPKLYSACSYMYDMSSEDTLKITQEIYEAGYINYPRTDSIFLSDEIYENIVSYLFETFKEEDKIDILKKKRKYKKKANFTQEAHEAIRPTEFTKEKAPENIAEYWKEQENTKNFGNYHKLVYELIWYRALCTQLVDSEYDRSKLTIKAGEYTFSIKANDRYKDGWEKYYGDLLNSTIKGNDNEDWRRERITFPDSLRVGMILEESEVYSTERAPRAPKRISEGTLITTLSNSGISRPSTLHTIIKNLKEKKYIESNKTLINITELGIEIYKVMENYLKWMCDAEIAIEFEKLIEDIEKGEVTNTDEILMYYWEKVKDFNKEIGYVEYKDKKPTKKQVDFVISLYKKLSEEEKNKYEISKITANAESVSKFIKERKK